MHYIYTHTVDSKKDSPQGLLAISRYHGAVEVEIVPTSFPDLPKPSRTPGKRQKTFYAKM